MCDHHSRPFSYLLSNISDYVAYTFQISHTGNRDCGTWRCDSAVLRKICGRSRGLLGSICECEWTEVCYHLGTPENWEMTLMNREKWQRDCPVQRLPNKEGGMWVCREIRALELSVREAGFTPILLFISFVIGAVSYILWASISSPLTILQVKPS